MSVRRGRWAATRAAGAVLGLSLLAACAGPGIRTGKPVRFSEPPREYAEEFPNWPHRPIAGYDEFKPFHDAGYELGRHKGAGSGVTGASKVSIHWNREDADLWMKCKPAPEGDLDGWNNAPRKELATYEVQLLFLDRPDFVVPTTGMICIPLSEWEREFGPSKPSIPGTRCVMNNLAVWLRDVTVPDVLYDEERFLTDPDYARYLANFNILTYLTNQRDGRRGNFLVAKDDSRRIVFAIDNGITFGAKIYNWFNPPSYAWQDIQVAALPRKSVDRLRKLRREDLDSLMVVNQLELDDEGILRRVRPGPALDPDEGVTIRDGTVQMGLTRREVDGVWERIRKLLEAVDSGRMPVF